MASIWITAIICITVFLITPIVCSTVRDVAMYKIENSGSGFMNKLFNLKPKKSQEDDEDV